VKLLAVVCLLFALTAFGVEPPCHPRITKTEAIRLAKKQLAHDWGEKTASHVRPWTAKLNDCVWEVTAVTSGASGDFYIEVGAETGKAWVGPHLRTDPKKLGKLIVPKS
jgi:hypothetical protein